MSQPQAFKKSSFGPAFFFLKPRQRKALANYYAFCRQADDIVDEPNVPNPAGQLKALQQEIEFVYVGAPKTPLGQALVKDVVQFSLPRDRFTLLLEGMQADLDKKRYNSFEELDWYLYRVAVIVGKATLDILGVRGEQADQLAQALGRAVQLTNIVRDVWEDAQLGRVYLPGNLTATEILQGARVQELQDMRKQAASLAHENYNRAFKLMDQFWPTTMLPCRIMGYIYQKNLAKIEQTGFENIRPVKLTKQEKIKQVLYAVFKTFF